MILVEPAWQITWNLGNWGFCFPTTPAVQFCTHLSVLFLLRRGNKNLPVPMRIQYAYSGMCMYTLALHKLMVSSNRGGDQNQLLPVHFGIKKPLELVKNGQLLSYGRAVWVLAHVLTCTQFHSLFHCMVFWSNKEKGVKKWKLNISCYKPVWQVQHGESCFAGINLSLMAGQNAIKFVWIVPCGSVYRYK